MGLGALFDIATSALMTTRKALDVTGNNIANVNTPEYSKQDAILEVNSPPVNLVGATGRGVNVAAVMRRYDSFIQTQMLLENQSNGRQNVLQDIYTKLEDAYNEQQGVGLASSITDFFNSWQDVSTNPESPEQRSVVLAKAMEIVTKAKTTEDKFTDIVKSIDISVPDMVQRINQLASNIAYYNDGVAQTEGGSTQRANDMRDKRQGALNELAGLINFNTLEDKTGRLTVIIGDRNLVSTGNIIHPMTIQKKVDGKMQLQLDGIDITSKVTGGKIGANLELKNSDQSGLPAAISELRRLIAALTNKVNIVQGKGYNLDGQRGGDIFTPPSVYTLNTNSSTASVASAVILDNTALMYKEYEVRFTGGNNYQLYDIKNKTSISGNLSGGKITVDGMQITFAGNPSTGDVFKISPIESAIRDAKVLVTNTSQLAAATSPAHVPGSNGNALGMTDLAKQINPELHNSTISDYYAVVVTTSGNYARTANDNLTFSNNMMSQIQQKRDSVSAVSLDEEAMNLVRFQKGFEAASRLINVTNDLLDILVKL
ncbi:MAG: flagellar hook-associated protein FlgK [Nitrospirae bacterium]|nr:flagellar hook-associated protein FlgK [Nitrospirota bacterium]